MTMNAEHARNEDPLIGTLLGGRYRIERRLGEGGAGIVYEGLHEELGRTVAVKVLGAAWASDPAAVERFEREARAASNIGHRHIIDVYDLGRLEDGRPYLVMERLRGEPLDAVLVREGRLPPERVVRIVAEAASALDAVHRKGIVHRDIKPENLFLAQDDSGGAPETKLLDFGLSAMSTPGASRLTRQGVVYGTPQYMAPEATGGDLPDHRADVYSLGVVAFELLAGAVPFDSPNPMNILAAKHVEDAPSLGEITGEVHPPAVEDVFARVLSRNPDLRYQTAGEFARALADACHGVTDDALTHPVSGMPAAPTRDAVRTMLTVEPLPTRKASVLVAAGLLALLAVGGGVGLWIAAGGDGAAEAGPTAGAVAETGSAPETESEPETRAAAETEAESEAEAEAGAESEGEAESATATAAADERPARRARRPRERGGSSPAATALAEPRTEPEPEPQAEEPPPALAEMDRARADELHARGTRAMLQGRLPEAIRLYRDATLAYPRHAAAWRGLGLANERLGRGPEAARAYRRYLALAPNAPDAAEVRRRLEGLD